MTFDKQVMRQPGLTDILDFQTNFVVCHKHDSEGACLPVKAGDQGKFYCQEDSDCESARAMLCVRNMTGNFNFTWWDFQHCIMEDKKPPRFGGDPKNVAPCAKTLSLDLNAINKCVNGNTGQALLGEALRMRQQLKPAYTYAPDLRINGGRSFRGTNFLKAICEAYTGPPPEGCSKARIAAIEEELLSLAYNVSVA